MALPLEQRGVKSGTDQALSHHKDSSSLSPRRNAGSRKLLEDQTQTNKTPVQAGCPDECPFRQIAVDEEDILPEFPEPEGDDGSLNAVAQRLYTRINGLWQTRILRLMPSPLGSALSGDLLVADIVLLPGLVLHDEGRLVSFHALSYCCGEAVLKRRIRLNGELLPITENLHLALQMLRQESEPIFLWVDAICIHQNLPEEKSQQVVNMFSIYRKANQVDIWLRTKGKATGVAMKILSSATKDLILHMHKHPRDFEILLDGIRELLSRPWFQRIWVKQELYAASKVVVHCGADVASGDVLAEWTTAVELLLQMQKRPKIMEAHCQILRSFRRATPGELIERDLPERPNAEQAQESHLDIINVLKRCAGSQCSQSQDHVYAVLGMTDVKHRAKSAASLDDEALIIDYTRSTVDVFIDITRHVIRRDKSLAVLHLNAVSGSTHLMIGLPSWVPDFQFTQRPLLRYFRDRDPETVDLKEDFSPQELLSPPVAVYCDDEIYRFELQSDESASSRLALTGYRIGSLVPDNTPWNIESYRIPNHGNAWNVFHERHVYRHGVPGELARKTETTMQAEVSALDLATIAIAVHQCIWRYQYNRSYEDTVPNQQTYIMVDIIWRRKLVCSVVVSWWKPRGYTLLWSVVSSDQYQFVQCSYTEDCYKRLQRLGALPSSWIVPSNAENDDLLIAVLGSPLPILVRPRLSTATWEYIGSAVPCNMRDVEISTGEAMSRIRVTESDRETGLLEEFILE